MININEKDLTPREKILCKFVIAKMKKVKKVKK